MAEQQIDYAALAAEHGGSARADAPPSAGTWEDRGIAGKVWHPADGAKETNREDNSVLGMPPELAAISGLSIGKAIGNTALTAVGRAVAGAKAAAGQAWPLVKYAAIQEAFEAAGVPRRYSVPASMLIVSWTGGAKNAAEAPTGPHLDRSVPMRPGEMTQQQIAERLKFGTGAPPTAPPPKPMVGVSGPTGAAPVEPLASGPVAPAPPAVAGPGASAPPSPAAPAPIPEAPPPGNALPDQKSLNEAALAVRRQAYQARTASAAAPEGAAAPYVKPAPLNEKETIAFWNYIRRGMSGADAMKNVELQRELAATLGTPTPTPSQTRFPKGMRGKATP